MSSSGGPNIGMWDADPGGTTGGGSPWPPESGGVLVEPGEGTTGLKDHEAHDAGGYLEAAVRRNPTAALSVALGVGFVLGWLLKRR
jgi:hypothetical protein